LASEHILTFSLFSQPLQARVPETPAGATETAGGKALLSGRALINHCGCFKEMMPALERLPGRLLR
jgi:hypothetical protein